MAYQENFNGYVAYKAQSGKGVQASGAGAIILPISGGQGGRLSKAAIKDPIIRQDAQQIRGRHGSQKTSGTYGGTISLGGIDPILAAVMRNSFSAADLAVTQATAGLTSITTTASTIVAAAGSWITAGLRVGDIVRLTGHSTAGNNSRNLRITALTALVMTVAETLIVDAVADTTFTVTRAGRSLVMPTAGNLVKTYFTIEEYEYGTDQSQIFTDCVFSRFRISMGADGVLTTEVSWTGTGQYQVLDTSSSPYFTSPSQPAALSMAAVDAALRVGTSDIIDLTSFDVTIDMQATAPAVTGPSKFSPDVFLGTQMVSANMTVMRKDLLDVADFIAENQLSLHLLGVQNETAPQNFFSLYIPNFTYGGIDDSAPSQQGGARTVTRSIPADLVGIDLRGGAYDATMIKMQVSNAT